MVNQSQFIEMFGDCSKTQFPVYKLGEICEVQRGGSPRPIHEYITKDPDGLNWIKIGDADDSMYISRTAEKIKPSGLNKTRKVYAGDLLLSNSMSFGRPYILKIDGCIHDGWLVLHFDHQKIDAEYLCSYLSQNTTYTELSKLAAGGVVSNLNSEVVKILPTILPPIDEQKRYVTVMRQADKTKFAGFKSQFIEMFDNPILWQKDNSLPMLSESVNVISGHPFDSELFNTKSEGIPLIRIRDIQRGYTETFTTESFDEQYRIKKGELLIGMDGMFDIARWQSDEAALNQRVCCLRMKNGENDTFIQYFVQPILKHIEFGTDATTVKHISTKQINAIRIPVVSKEQKKHFEAIAQLTDKSKYLN